MVKCCCLRKPWYSTEVAVVQLPSVTHDCINYLQVLYTVCMATTTTTGVLVTFSEYVMHITTYSDCLKVTHKGMVFSEPDVSQLQLLQMDVVRQCHYELFDEVRVQLGAVVQVQLRKSMIIGLRREGCSEIDIFFYSSQLLILRNTWQTTHSLLHAMDYDSTLNGTGPVT